jgi:hypothetical protein
MEKQYFQLGNTDNNRIVRVIRIAFGIVCILVSVYWLFFNIRSAGNDGTVWITVFFLTGFGGYQILDGAGFTKTYIEFDNACITLRKNPVLPAVRLSNSDIEVIEMHPLNVNFRLKTGRKVVLRFGATQIETNELIKDALLDYSENSGVKLIIVEEKM